MTLHRNFPGEHAIQHVLLMINLAPLPSKRFRSRTTKLRNHKMYRSSMTQLSRCVLRRYSSGSTVKTVETAVVERSLNKITLLGRVGRDAEMKGTDSNPMALFSLATSETFRIKKDEEDELRQRTSWHRVNVFKPGLRDAVYSYCKKGSRVLVFGRLNYSEYYNDSDQKITTTNIVADDVIFVGGGSSVTELTKEDLVSEPIEHV